MAAPSTRGLLGSLSALTLATGLVDAVTVLGMSVFAANMTGNIAFLGFSLGGSPDYSVGATLSALIGFVVGAFAAGHVIRDRFTRRTGGHALALQTALAAVAAVLAATVGYTDTPAGWTLLLVLGAALGLQNVVALKSGESELKTTVMTLTVAGLAADLARGRTKSAGKRLWSVALLLVGATAGAWMFTTLGLAPTMAAATVMMAVAAAVMYVGGPREEGTSEGQGPAR